MKKATQNIKAGDRLRCQFECDVEVIAPPKSTDDDTCEFIVRVLHGPFVNDAGEAPEIRIEEPPRALLEYLGNVSDIDAQIQELQKQRAQLKGYEPGDAEVIRPLSELREVSS